MGEMIAVAYPVEADYDVNDERHMFDDGLSGDDGDDLPEDNSTDGDTSSNYEELAKGVRGESDCEGGDGKEEKELEVDESEVTSNAEEEKVADISIISGSEYDDDTSIDTTDIDTTPTKAQTTPDKAPLPQVKTLTDLRKANIMLTKQAEARDKLHWKVKELQEMIREIERQIPEAESNLQAAQEHLESNKEQFKGYLIASGLSPELFEAFSDFCESLYPKYGLREGFSVDLEGKHGGSYVEYDPTFKIFKDNVETDYKTCNFRCEATTVEDSWLMDEEDGTYESEEIDIVQFFPVRSPEPVAGSETTWGMQYVSYLTIYLSLRLRASMLQRKYADSTSPFSTTLPSKLPRRAHCQHSICLSDFLASTANSMDGSSNTSPIACCTRSLSFQDDGYSAVLTRSTSQSLQRRRNAS